MGSRALVEFVLNRKSVYLLSILVSVALSLWLGAHETVINPDGICYLESAADIASSGIQAASQLCEQAKWPFYSVLIYATEKTTHLTFESSALALDGLLSLLTVISFIYLVHLLGGTQRTLWLAAAIILFAHEFDAVRQYIIRDHGYWAFYLLSMVCLLQYFRLRRAYFAYAWGLSMVAAALFRIEGIMFLLFMPVVAWFDRSSHWFTRFERFLQLNLVLIGGVIAACLWLMLSSSPHAHWGRLLEVQAQLQHGVVTLQQNFHAAAIQLGNHVLSPYAAADAGLLLCLLLVAWYVYSVVSSLSCIYTFLVLFAWWRKLLTLDKPAQWVLLGYVAVNVVVTAAYLAENLFISKRYLVALALVFMLWTPFALTEILHYRRRGLLQTAVIIFLVMNAVSVLYHFGASKNYIRDAGSWLEQNVPVTASLYSNDEQVMYYSNHFGTGVFAHSRSNIDLMTIAHEQWKHYDYLALRINKHDTQAPVLQEMKISPVKIFANRRGDKVLIYRVMH